MPYYRHVASAEIVHTKAGSKRDADLAADEQWSRTPDKDDDKPVASDDLNANPEASV